MTSNANALLKHVDAIAEYYAVGLKLAEAGLLDQDRGTIERERDEVFRALLAEAREAFKHGELTDDEFRRVKQTLALEDEEDEKEAEDGLGM
ncbi:hypothetical protein [Thermosulfurimonas sp. F29]|uniref:hypothetical protein n=1 Tax=Thermosulfurimonas sp. F29 TaxID=2867247 RepID=UPI001C8400FB|nr:hypothetical protein [Thermosulfurimonas sp. F29]MBX6423792.1 hypothetical protein [Thermosulfurimonas sp. F29]